jgi:hypothetical protein
MARGTIISLTPLQLLPTFAYACTYSPTFLPLVAKQLAAWGRSILCRRGEPGRGPWRDLSDSGSSVNGREAAAAETPLMFPIVFEA